MVGPMAATMRAGSAPSATMPMTVPVAMPPIAPFQPAWKAPITPASESASSTGVQSAVRMPRRRPGTLVTSASASRRSPGLGGAVRAVTTVAARAASKTGPRRAANVALSAVYNLEYYRGMAEEFGDPRELLRRFDAVSSRS